MAEIQGGFVIGEDLQTKIDRIKPNFVYHIQHEIGQGKNKSKVYRAVHQNTGQFVAVKKTKLKSSSDDGQHTWTAVLQSVEQWVDHFLAIGDLKHQNIVSQLGLELDRTRANKPCLVLLMEYCPATLYSRIRKGLVEAEIRRFGLQVVTGLAYLHDQGICHLDLKTENILIAEDNVLKICDFEDIIKLQSVSGTRTWEIPADGRGTPRYMAPESIMPPAPDPSCSQPGRATDIYCFGCILIEMTTGKVPQYKNKAGVYLTTEIQLMYFISAGGVPEIPNASSDIRELMESCIARDPVLRLRASELVRHPALLKGQFYATCADLSWIQRSINFDPGRSTFLVQDIYINV